VTQRRTLNGPRGRTTQGGLEVLDFDAVRAESRGAAEQALELLSAPECPTEKTTVVLAPDQMMLQIHESVGHPLELDRILGDERILRGLELRQADDIGGLRFGSDLMNIVFDPTVAGELASYGADDIGNPARRETSSRMASWCGRWEAGKPGALGEAEWPTSARADGSGLR
jgi:predicted Zn-dependent protease